MRFNFKDISAEFKKIIDFNKKFNKQTELKERKKEELNKANTSLEKLEEKLTKLREKEYNISSKLPEEQASSKLQENRSKQEKKQSEINKKKEKILSINVTYQKYEQKYLKMLTEKNSAIIDLDLKIAKLEDKLDELRKNWSNSAEKLNENYAKMRKINKDSQEYKDLEEENEKHREVMRNNVITSETGMKLKTELDNIKNMKRILENGEIIEELVKESAEKESTKAQSDTETVKTDANLKESEKKVEQESTIKQEETKTTETAKEAKTGTKEPRTTGLKATQQKTTGMLNEETSKTIPAPKTEIKRATNSQQAAKTVVTPKEVKIKPYSELTVKELEAKRRELWERVGDDAYHFRAHKENGMEGYEEDDIDKELKLIREELERRKNKETELKWHQKLTEEQIMYAKENDIYEPKGPEYEQFLSQLGINKEADKTETEKSMNSDKKDSLFKRFLNAIKKLPGNIKKRIENFGRKQLSDGKIKEAVIKEENKDQIKESFIQKVEIDEVKAMEAAKEKATKEKEELTK